MNSLTSCEYLATSQILLHNDMIYIFDTSVFAWKVTFSKENSLFQENMLDLQKDFYFVASKRLETHEEIRICVKAQNEHKSTSCKNDDYFVVPPVTQKAIANIIVT